MQTFDEVLHHLKTEADSVQNNLLKLKEFKKNELFFKLLIEEQTLIDKQIFIMEDYIKILQVRIHYLERNNKLYDKASLIGNEFFIDTSGSPIAVRVVNIKDNHTIICNIPSFIFENNIVSFSIYDFEMLTNISIMDPLVDGEK